MGKSGHARGHRVRTRTAEVRFRLAAWRTRPRGRDAGGLSRSGRGPGYLSQHGHPSRTDGRQVGQCYRHAAFRARVGGWAVGGQPKFFPEGLALRVPKGSDLVVQYHFHPTGKAQAEKSLIGLYFAKKPPERTLTRIQMPPHYSLFSGLDIPPGEKDFVIHDSCTLPVAVDGVGIGAHAHY